MTFVERQIAHVWGASTIGCSLLYVIEMLLGMPVLTLAPVLAVFSGMVFLIKAGILSGAFYIPAVAALPDGGDHGDLASVRDHDLWRRISNVLLRARSAVSPPPRACGGHNAAHPKRNSLKPVNTGRRLRFFSLARRSLT